MRARDIVGRKIVAVKQERVASDEGYDPFTAFDHIELDDGTTLTILVHERPDDYGVELVVHKRKQK